MINLSPEICRELRDARRKAGISQSVLAAEVGCKQSALSMFESRGDGTKLNDEVIRKLAKKFGISLEEEKGEPRQPAVSVQSAVAAHSGYCPNPDCPSHHRYEIDGRVFLRPDRASEDPVGGRYCAVCGELLERRCPNCGAPVHDGAICSFCGEPYIAV